MRCNNMHCFMNNVRKCIGAQPTSIGRNKVAMGGKKKQIGRNLKNRKNQFVSPHIRFQYVLIKM